MSTIQEKPRYKYCEGCQARVRDGKKQYCEDCNKERIKARKKISNKKEKNKYAKSSVSMQWLNGY